MEAELVKINGVDCGCESRKRIMFTEGQPGLAEAILVTLAVTAVMAAIVVAFRRAQ